jgi:hypothetical protein
MTTGGPKRAATILSGSASGEDAEGEGSGEALDGVADGFFEGDWRLEWGAPAFVLRFGAIGDFSTVLFDLLDEVGDDFGVGFGDEDVALGGEFALELEVVFDDAVVDDDDAAGAVAVGVGVFFGGAAVGGPAGVADAVRCRGGGGRGGPLRCCELAGGAAEFELFLSGAADGDAG